MIGARRTSWLLLAPGLVLVMAVLVLPAAAGLVRSFTAPIGGHATFVGLGNYAALASSQEARTAFQNAVVYALLSAPLSVAVGLGLASAIASARHRESLRLLFLSPWLASPVAVGVLWRFFINNPIGLPNLVLTQLGQPLALGPLSNPTLALPIAALVDVWRSSPLAAFLLVPGVLGIPRDLREQAAMDGASGWRIFWSVWLPRLRPLLVVVLLLRLADALGTADTLYTLTHGGPADRTTTLALYSYVRILGIQDWGRGLAAAWMIVLLAVALSSLCLWLARERR
jgi:multiple sugar transport system permease protein